MAHEIFGDRFISRKEPAWHRIARRIFDESEEITARQAMQEVAGGIDVRRAPVFYELDGVMTRSQEHAAIVRMPTPEDNAPRVFGVTSESWAAASYPDLAGALDELSKTHKVETAGILKKGGYAFLCFRAPDWAVKGTDPMRSYFAANFSLIPGLGHKVFHSPIRVVCWNTLTMAEGQSTINLRIPHAADALQRIQLAAALVSKFQEAQSKTRDIFDAFADHYITQAEARSVFEAAFPAPPLPAKVRLLKQTLSEAEAAVFRKSIDATLLEAIQAAEETYQRNCETVTKLRGAAIERYEAFEPSAMRGTAWAAYNAATEVSDWREGRGADESLLYGTRAQEKSRAFSKALALVEA